MRRFEVVCNDVNQASLRQCKKDSRASRSARSVRFRAVFSVSTRFRVVTLAAKIDEARKQLSTALALDSLRDGVHLLA
jgi:hypothetical protein